VKIEVHDAMTRELLVKGGARADGIQVYVPEVMVQKALAATPRRWRYCDRLIGWQI
jgi:trimethylamine:corrinoid methyltransferase-like protein